MRKKSNFSLFKNLHIRFYEKKLREFKSMALHDLLQQYYGPFEMTKLTANIEWYPEENKLVPLNVHALRLSSGKGSNLLVLALAGVNDLPRKWKFADGLHLIKSLHFIPYSDDDSKRIHNVMKALQISDQLPSAYKLTSKQAASIQNITNQFNITASAVPDARGYYKISGDPTLIFVQVDTDRKGQLAPQYLVEMLISPTVDANIPITELQF